MYIRPSPTCLFLFDKIPLRGGDNFYRARTEYRSGMSNQQNNPVPAIPATGAAPSGNSGSASQPGAIDVAGITGIRAEWEVTKPQRAHYAEIVQLLSQLRENGEGSIFRRGPHVQASHLGFFRPETDAFFRL